MIRILGRLTVVAAAILLLVGCGENTVKLDPPDVKYGEDISEMGMFVVDPRYTVAALPQEGDWILFDDIGELFKYHDRFPGTRFRATWVNDYHTQQWTHAEDAWYVQSPGLKTPMGWGVAAFADEAEAHAFQTGQGGTMMTWDEAQARAWDTPPAPHDEVHTATPEATPSTHDHG
jgi:copper chaperone NosL